MKINEIIIIVVSVLFFTLIPIHYSSRIAPRVKQIIGVLYAIFALVSMILNIIENQRLKNSINKKTTTSEYNANNRDRMKSGGLAFLGMFLIICGIVFVFLSQEEK